MQILLSTVGPLNVTLDDLDGRTFTHPTLAFNLLSEFSADEVSNSSDLQNAINTGTVTVVDEYNQVIGDTLQDLSDIRQITASSPIFNAKRLRDKLIDLSVIADQAVLTYDLVSDKFILTNKSAFSNDFSSIESEAKSTTTSNTLQTKLTHTVTLLAGSYLVGWYCEVRNEDEDDGGVKLALELDGTAIAEVAFYGEDEDEEEIFKAFTGQKILSLNGAHNLKLRYAVLKEGSAEIRRANITLWRVS